MMRFQPINKADTETGLRPSPRVNSPKLTVHSATRTKLEYKANPSLVGSDGTRRDRFPRSRDCVFRNIDDRIGDRELLADLLELSRGGLVLAVGPPGDGFCSLVLGVDRVRNGRVGSRGSWVVVRSEEHTSELQSLRHLV